MDPKEGLVGFLVGAAVAGATRGLLKVAQPYLPASVTRYPEVVPGVIGLAGLGLAAVGYRDVAFGTLAVSGAMLADDLSIRFGRTQTA